VLGFGGHFLTKSRRYGITFTYICDERLAFVCAATVGPERDPEVASDAGDGPAMCRGAP
jgi:hypothetical protein